MFRRVSLAAALCACCASSLFADFTYEQSSKVTGGAMAGMMKVAGAFSRQAREPMRSTVIVKGDRMATISGDHVNVIDLSKETFTDIDTKNKTYSTITFADMMRAMAQASEKVKGNQTDFTISADVKNTGASRVVSGMEARQTVLTVKMEGTDKKSGEKVNMVVSSDMWMTPSMAGYQEVRDFYTKMAQKMSWSPNGGFLGAFAAQQPGMSKGFAEVTKEMAKLDGVPVLQVMRMTGAPAGMSEADMAALQQAQQQEAQQQQQPAPTVSEAAGQAATGAALGRSGRVGAIAGGLGGFGGFGRKKKQEEKPKEQTQAAPPPAAPAPTTSAAPPGTLIELTTELTSFSSGSADTSKFDVPAGFKQIEHPMQKALK